MKVLITGGSRGIGLATLKKFKQEGHKCTIVSRNKLGFELDNIQHLKVDLSSNESVSEACETILASEFDILINNAGINKIGTIDQHTPETIAEVIQVNSLSHIKIIQACVPHMKKQKFGRIVNISSIWSFKSRTGRSVYSASKSFLDGLTRALCCELGPHGILVNSVAPGFILTELTKANMDSDTLNTISGHCPAGRLGQPEEVASLVYYLGSNSNTYINGETILIDGGYSKHG